MLHPMLQPFRDVKFIGRINRVVRKVIRELEGAGGSDLAVEVWSNRDASVLYQLFTIRLNYEPNQWSILCGEACGYRFRLTLPFRNGVTLPYQLEIFLNATSPVRATLGAWLTSRGDWFTEPLNRRNGTAIRKLRLPGVGWTHASAGLKHTLREGGHILPSSDDCVTSRWIVHSAYQGFILVRPRVVKYLRAAERLDTLLHTMQ